ncbi:MAG: ABC transporter permease subunit [Spirochaetes bacterium]|jgi:raffinose/stachyose/melibiose transport system permease protein|nr:ABC transporter permease subunit [Spirochaetota bacterium]
MAREALTRGLTATDVIAKIAKWAVLVFFLFSTFVPLVWLLVGSLKTNLELQTEPFSLPDSPQFVNYVNAVEISGLHRLFLNSLFVSGASTVINLIVVSMAAYVFSRFTFKFQNALLNLILAGVLVPIVALMVPYFRIITSIGLYDSLWALVVTYSGINIPISLFLVHGFMKTIPKELEEASIIDGCGFFQRYSRIVLPLSKLGLVTAGTFAFLFSWNEFIYALLLTASEKSRTLQLGIRFFTSQFRTDYTSMYAAIIIAIIPMIIVYITLHERIIKGLTAGAVKG